MFCCIPTEILPLCKVLEADKRVVWLVSTSYNYLQTFSAMSLLQCGPVARLWLLLLVGLPWHTCPHLSWLHTSERQVTPPSTAATAALYTMQPWQEGEQNLPDCFSFPELTGCRSGSEPGRFRVFKHSSLPTAPRLNMVCSKKEIVIYGLLLKKNKK